MSVATEFAPVVFIPERARRPERPQASVIVLFAPGGDAIAAPIRLTRRGVALIAATVAALAAVLIGVAIASAPGSHPEAKAPATVAVRAGDTLWSIASQVAPGRDPRAEIADLQRLNHLAGVDLVTGQVLRTR